MSILLFYSLLKTASRHPLEDSQTGIRNEQGRGGDREREGERERERERKKERGRQRYTMGSGTYSRT